MLTLLLSLALADTVSVDVPPSQVTVYADRARVTRSTRVQLSRGVHEVAFTDLPPTADLSALTADVSGGAELLDIQTRIIPAAEVADARVAALRDALQDLQDERQDHADDIRAADVRLASVAQARAASAQQLSAQLLVGERGPQMADALLRELSDEEASARTARRTAVLAKRDIEERIAAAERELATLGSTATDTREAVVRIDVTRSGAMDVDLTYTVRGASWTPRYDLRGDGSTGEVELSLSAIVRQTTGEDWDGVTLAVSSAQPGRGTDVPVLDPFWLTQVRPRRSSVAHESMDSGGGRSRPMAAMAEPAAPPPPMEVMEAVVDTQLAATTFRVTSAETMPSDGTSRKVLLTQVDLDSELRHVSVPRLDPAAFLVGEVTNTADFPLLPGPAGVFIGDAYVGDIQLDTVPTRATFDVSFGPDERVSVTRERGETTTGAGGPIGRRQSAEWEWVLTVRSEHRRPVTVELREQVPISPREDVEVEYELTDGEAVVEEEDQGVLSMTTTVPAGRERELTWGYTVTYPGDLTLGWME